MEPLYLLPLVAVSLASGVVLLSTVHRPTRYRVTRLALALFGAHVSSDGTHRASRRRRLQSAHVSQTYRVYAANTLLYTAFTVVVGSVLGVYLIAGIFTVLSIPRATMAAVLPDGLGFVANVLTAPRLSLSHLFVLLFASSATVGVLLGVATYQIRWLQPEYDADARARRIDESLPRTVAFLYALSRSGMSFPAILRSLAANRSVYGESAREVGLAVKQMDLVGLDLISAIEVMGRRTPNEKFGEFSENLASVLQSGRNLPAFLEDQHELYREEARAQQEQFLQLLATLGEAYVSVFVVGPLLLITVLVIAGLMRIADTVAILEAFTYLVIPAMTFGFVVYLDSITESLRASRTERESESLLVRVRHRSDGEYAPVEPEGGTVRGDGGAVGDPETLANAERFAAHRRYRWLRRAFDHPVRSVRERPTTLLIVTVPVALAFVAFEVVPLLRGGSVSPAAVDDPLVQASLFVLGTFSVAQWSYNRRLQAIEAAIPDFLERLANVNDAGMTLIESFGRVANSDLGALDEEIGRAWADVRWGADVESAFHRLEARLRTPTVTRVVTLLTNAMNSSGDLAPVLRIAAHDAQATRRLRRERRQELFTYLVIIYLSFLVFLVIVGALVGLLIPSLPTGADVGTAGTLAGPTAGIGLFSGVDVAAYKLLLYHTALIQGVCSGLVAGQMGEGSLKNGAKHATAMLLVAYVVFLLL